MKENKKITTKINLIVQFTVYIQYEMLYFKKKIMKYFSHFLKKKKIAYNLSEKKGLVTIF